MILTVAILCGCGTLYNGIVTITQVRDSAMKELAALSKQGKISDATDTKIEVADKAYREAAETASKALIAYKAGGDKGQYVAALMAVKVAIASILDILTPMISQSEALSLNTSLSKATKL